MAIDLNAALDPDGVKKSEQTLNERMVEAASQLKYSEFDNKGYETADKSGSFHSADYEGYSNIGVFPDVRDINAQRGNAQGAWEQFNNTFMRTVGKAGTTIANSFGYLPEILDLEQDYSNPVTRAMEGVNTYLDTSYPVYRKNTDAIDFGDFAWYMNSAESLISSIAGFAVGGAGIARMVSAVGKVAGIGMATAEVANSASALFGAARGVGFGTAVANTGRNLVTSGLMAYVEGAMSGDMVFKQVYNKRLKELTDNGMEYESAEQWARVDAAKAASTTTQLSTILNTGLNFVGGVNQFFKAEGNAAMRVANRELGMIAGEGTGEWARRLRSIEGSTFARELADTKTFKQATLKKFREAGSESLEEVNTQFAEQAGLSDGEKGVITQFKSMANYVDYVWNEEGALNAMLGAVGGVGQQAITQNVPMHKSFSHYSTENGKYINADGKVVATAEEAQKNYHTTKIFGKEFGRVTNKQIASSTGIKRFNDIRDKVVADVEEAAKFRTDMAALVASGDVVGAKALSNEYFNLVSKQSILAGTGQALQGTFDAVLAIDNTLTDTEEIQEKLDAAVEQQQKVVAEGGNTLEADKTVTFFEAELAKTKGQTSAMMLGFAVDKTDNEYLDKAREAKKDLDYLSTMRENTNTKYGANPESAPEVQYIADMVFERKANLYYAKRQLEEFKKKEASLRSNTTDESIGVLSSTLDTMRTNAAAIQKLQTAIASLSDPTTKSFENTLYYYGNMSFENASINDVKDLKAKLNGLLDSRIKEYNKAEETERDNDLFKEWADRTGSQDFAEFIQDMSKDAKETATKMAYKEAIEQETDRIKIAEDTIAGMDNAAVLAKVVKSAQEYDRFMQDRANERAKQLQEEKNERLQAFNDLKLHKLETLSRLRDSYVKEYKQSIADSRARLQEMQELKDLIGKFSVSLNSPQIYIETWKQLKEQLQELRAYHEEQVERRSELLRRMVAVDGKKRSIAETAIELGEDPMVENELSEAIDNEAAIPNEAPEETPEPEIPTELEIPDPVVEPAPAPTVGTPEVSSQPIDLEIVTEYANTVSALPVEQQMFTEDLRKKAVNGGLKLSLNSLKEVVTENPVAVAADTIAFVNEQKEAIELLDNLQAAILDVRDYFPDVVDSDITDFPVDNEGIPSLVPDTILGEVNNTVFEGSKQLQPSMSLATKTTESVIKTKKGVVVDDVDARPKLLSTVNPKLFDKRALPKGTAIRFEIDTEYDGTVIDFEATDREGRQVDVPDNFQMYDNGSGSVDLNDDAKVGNVAIKIVEDATGETIGYVHRTDWVGAFVDGEFKNVVDQKVNSKGEVILEDNANKQVQALLDIRRKVIRDHNAGKVTSGKLGDRSIGSLNIMPQYRQASTHLKGAKLGIVYRDGGMVRGVATTAPIPKGWNNATVAVLTANNGEEILTAVKNRILAESPNATNTIRRIFELHLTPSSIANSKEVDIIREHTGFDVGTNSGMRNFIIQYFTYFSNIASITKTNETGSFLTMIGGKVAIVTRETMGISKDEVYATLGRDGKLSQEFTAALDILLKQRRRSTVLTNDGVGIIGVNSPKDFKYIIYKPGTKNPWKPNYGVKKGNTITYNDWLMKDLRTRVTYSEGPNPDGSVNVSNPMGGTTKRFVYDNNPVTSFELDEDVNTPEIVSTPTALEEAAKTAEENRAPDDLFADFDDLFGGSSAESKPVASTNEVELTVEFLQKVYDATPLSIRDESMSPAAKYLQLKANNTDMIGKNFNPFIKC